MQVQRLRDLSNYFTVLLALARVWFFGEKINPDGLEIENSSN